MKYDTILWDLDGTLLDFKLSERYALGVCLKTYGIEMTEEMLALYSGINERYWERLERGEVTKKELLQGRFACFFQRMGFTHIDPMEIQKQYERELGTMTYYRDNSYDVLKRLKEMGVKQYLVTNGVMITQQIKLKNSGFDKLIDQAFISDELGYEKPRPEFFEKAFARLSGFHREKSLLVGDSLTSDIKGANNAGVDACWYHPDGKPFPAGSEKDGMPAEGQEGETPAENAAGNPRSLPNNKGAESVHIEYMIKNLEEIFTVIM